MDDRVRLYVLGISYSRLQSGAFALLLAQKDGPYRIPVVIGAPEAQAIAMKIEGVLPPRPLTHDLFVSFTHAFGIKLKEVFIYKFEDGIFSSELTFTDGTREIAIDSRTSDAIAIAMRTNAPIFTTKALLKETGFIIENEQAGNNSDNTANTNDETESREEATNFTPRLENYAIEQLEATLQSLIEEENYEEAAKVSEILERKKRRRDNHDDTDSPERQQAPLTVFDDPEAFLSSLLETDTDIPEDDSEDDTSSPDNDNI